MRPTVAFLLLLLLPGPMATADDEGPRLVDGQFGQALDARTGGFVAPADERFERRPLTVELWARLLDRDRGAVLLSHESPASGTHWELFIAAGSGDLGLGAPGLVPPLVMADGPLGDGRWHHVALLLEATRVRIAIDGEIHADQEVTSRPGTPRRSGLAVGTRIEDRRPNPVLIDDLRISEGLRDVVAPPDVALVADEQTVMLWDFDESEAEYLARWTPGGETNQPGLPYPHRYAAYEFEKDPDWVDGRWQATDKGPFVTHSTRLPGRQVGPKLMTLFLGPDRSTAAVFDLERCSVVAGLTGATWTTDPMRFGLLRKPTLDGDSRFYVDPAKAWRRAVIDDRRLEVLGRDEVDYKGLHLHGDRVLLTYSVLGGRGEETLEEMRYGEEVVIARHLRVDGLAEPAVLTLAEFPTPAPGLEDEPGLFTALASRPDPLPEIVRELRETYGFKASLIATQVGDRTRAVALISDSSPSHLFNVGADVCLPLRAGEPWSGTVLYWSGPSDRSNDFMKLANSSPAAADFDALRRPGPRRWGDPIVTAGTLGEDDGRSPFVVDTITIPHENPFGTLFFITALDFFPNGDAAVCTAHGDVWIVRGIDDDLARVSWQRFATGLYQPLGLKVVDGKVIVLGRDQLTRLHDEDGDGEADFYESFNNDLIIQGQDHAFVMRLETDPEGNFYFLKSGGGPHGEALLRVAADGSGLSVVARGFRHPYGLGVGPDGQVTVADNEGNWVPSSKIDLIREGGFHGFLGTAREAPEGVRPDPPLCYVPKVADNSSGGQVWYTGDRWGDYHRGGMLHLSWGRCTLHAVLQDEVDGIRQAATVRFPGLSFLSGSGEGAFSPADGQLYVVGLNGWQTAAAADGSFQRVRQTGRPIHMPAAFEAFEDGIRVAFSRPIDPSIASDPRRYRIERWNYRWSETYGSFHYSAADPDRIGHDPVPITAAEPLPDGRGVFLRVDDMAPVDQLWLATDLLAEDGTPLRFDLYATIHALRPASSAEVGGGR